MARFVLVLLLLAANASNALAVTPGNNWLDSYSVGNQCYCISTFDHDAGSIVVETPAGPRTTRQICEAIGPGPGVGSNPIYNDLQCGNGPPNNAPDEVLCPGRVDMGADGCFVIGPTWNLEQYFPADEVVGTDTGADTGAGTDTTGNIDVDVGNNAEEGNNANVAAVDPVPDVETTPDPNPGAEAQAIQLVPMAGDRLVFASAYSSKDDRWVLIDSQWIAQLEAISNSTEIHLNSSNSAGYLKVLPDLKVADSDPITADSVWDNTGAGPQLHYDIELDLAGRYQVFARMYSSGPYDDSMAVAIDGQWSANNAVLQTCGIRNAWTWSDCPDTTPAYLEVVGAGVHTLQFSALEDGVEFDQFVLRRIDDESLPALAQAVSVGSGIGFGAGALDVVFMMIGLLLLIRHLNNATAAISVANKR